MKVITNNKCDNIIKKDYKPLKVNCKIYEREGLFMKETKDVILDEVINEEIYQQFKKEICKKDDYFSEKELYIIYEKIITE